GVLPWGQPRSSIVNRFEDEILRVAGAPIVGRSLPRGTMLASPTMPDTCPPPPNAAAWTQDRHTAPATPNDVKTNDMLTTVLDWFLHLECHLSVLAAEYQVLVYVLLFAVIFVETGVVVMPFLPGDSLLFVTGALAAKGLLSLPILIPLLIVAAVVGDIVNFAIGSACRNRFQA